MLAVKDVLKKENPEGDHAPVAAVHGKIRHVPLISNLRLRTCIGLLILFSCVGAHAMLLSRDQLIQSAVAMTGAWLLSVLLTDKYVHKYPQRYFSYVLAAHFKSWVIFGMVLGTIVVLADPALAQRKAMLTAWLVFSFIDGLVSALRRRDYDSIPLPLSPAVAQGGTGALELIDIDTAKVLAAAGTQLNPAARALLEKHLPVSQGAAAQVLVLDDIPAQALPTSPGTVALMVGKVRVNDVRRLNQFIVYCAEQLAPGGYLSISYTPLENVTKSMRTRYPGWLFRPVFLLHFICFRALPKTPWLDTFYFSKIGWLDTLLLSLTKRRNRILSKAEMWGRLAFAGIDVIAESEGDGELQIVARKIGQPSANKRPSYYPIVALEKVGLDGKSVRMHKVRSMFPFSEFIQKKIFENNGLTQTGKFKDDFRLTEYGKFIRRYWIDELPQIYDWLRGEVKLVGMRATSRHFLGLYPQELYNLYIEVKPGLIPPIFDETVKTFDHIVEVELTYLRLYAEQPLRTDIRYLMQTFTDIVFRGVRSK